ncbi:MAG TPA: phosphodiesterase [Acetobacteraceae bacterium]|nr:phosphodiesterase [Acetobacteraceae bacterium]
MLICQVTDLHLCPPGRLAYGAIDTNAMTERALAAVAALDPAPQALLVTGDLAEGGRESEYSLFLTLIRRHLNVPVYVIPGNHDSREPLRRVLGGLPGLGDRAGFIQYVVDDLPVRLVMLDTLTPGHNHGELCAERLDFLERSLAAAPGRPTMIAMHHPPFDSGIGFMDRDNLRDAKAFTAIVSRHPQVERIICGHVHRSVTAMVAKVPVLIAPSACHHMALALAPDAPGAFVLDPPAFSVHCWAEASGIVSHIAYVGPCPGPFPFTR